MPGKALGVPELFFSQMRDASHSPYMYIMHATPLNIKSCFQEPSC